METYANLSGVSGILAYQSGVDYITVQFRVGQHTFYRYTNSSAGNAVIEMLKSLARQGRGLNSYISTYKPGYNSKASSLAGLY